MREQRTLSPLASALTKKVTAAKKFNVGELSEGSYTVTAFKNNKESAYIFTTDEDCNVLTCRHAIVSQAFL